MQLLAVTGKRKQPDTLKGSWISNWSVTKMVRECVPWSYIVYSWVSKLWTEKRADKGCMVTSIEYFTDTDKGHGELARRRFRRAWVQTDATPLTIFLRHRPEVNWSESWNERSERKIFNRWAVTGLMQNVIPVGRMHDTHRLPVG